MSLRHLKLKRRRYYLKNGRTLRNGARVRFWPNGQLRSHKTKEYIDVMKAMEWISTANFFENKIKCDTCV